MSEFKVGDKVVLKLDWRDRTNRSHGAWVSWCKQLTKGVIYEVKAITSAGSIRFENSESQSYDPNCFILVEEEWVPQQGELIEVRQALKWCKREFIAFDRELPVCRNNLMHTQWTTWKEYRKLEPKHIITIDGEDITVSEESFLALKKSLLK